MKFASRTVLIVKVIVYNVNYACTVYIVQCTLHLMANAIHVFYSPLNYMIFPQVDFDNDGYISFVEFANCVHLFK